MAIIGQGAEATITLKEGVVYKERFAKSYRHPVLDQKLRTSRSNKERKILLRAKELGVRVPELLSSSDKTTLVLEFCVGPRLRDVLIAHPKQTTELIKIGKWIAILHDADVVHGDLTTSNVLVTQEGPVLIDFGLSQITKKIEDRAVDLHLLEQALESTHPITHEYLFSAFLEGYTMSSTSEEVLQRLEVVRSRGRNNKH